MAATKKVPVGTRIYCELMQRVESKKKRFQVGDQVHTRVWRDVVIDGEVVIPRGALIETRVTFLKTAKIAGVKGKLELGARTLVLDDGTEIPLSGGYGKRGKGNKVLSISLAAVVAWPLIFITGRKAVLEPGTIFDAYVDKSFSVEIASAEELPTLSFVGMDGPTIEVTVPYEELASGNKLKTLPLNIVLCGRDSFHSVVINTINGMPIDEPMTIVLGEPTIGEQRCLSVRGSVELKPLIKQFRKGINRFTVTSGSGDDDLETEVILNIQI